MRNAIGSVVVLLLCSSASATEGDEFLKELERVARGVVNGYLDDDALIRGSAPFRYISCTGKYCAPAGDWPYRVKVESIDLAFDLPRGDRNPRNNVRMTFFANFQGRLPLTGRLTGDGIFGHWSRAVPPLKMHGDVACVYVRYESKVRKVFAIAEIYGPDCGAEKGWVPEVSSVHLNIYKDASTQD